MDFYKAIRQLQVEKARLDRVISSLEELQKAGPAAPAEMPKKKRGRKFMDARARREVSERMKRYWEQRRKQSGTDPKP